MATPIPRPTRSRFSSPFVPAPSNPSAETSNTMADGSERQQTLLDRWIEPPIPAPRPSFMDAGIERQGVVQNMAPLGTGPSQKLLKTATKSEGELLFRAAKRSEASAVSTPTPSESVMTPEPPTNPSRERSASVTTVKDAESAPQTPQPPLVHRNSISRASVGPQNSGQSVSQLQPSPIPLPSPVPLPSNDFTQPTPPPPAQSEPVVIRRYHMSTPGPTLGADGLPLVNREITDKVVEEAVKQALDSQRWPTAYALRTLYDDHREDIRMVRLIEAIYYQRSSPSMRMQFANLMRMKKKEGLRDRTAEYYFNGDEGFSATEKRQLSLPIMSAIQAFNPQPKTEYASPYTPLPRMAASLQGRSSSVNNLPSSTAKEIDEDEHVNKKPRRSSYSTHFTALNYEAVSANAEINGAASDHANGTKMVSPEPTPEANGVPKSDKSTPGKVPKGTPGKERRGSTSSLSSVSSSIVADEEQNSNSNNTSGGNIEIQPQPAFPPLLSSLSSIGRLSGLGAALGGLGAARTRQFVSPYTSADNFIAAASSAETHARNQAQPIAPPPKAGPKMGVFNVTVSSTAAKSTSPAVAPSSSAKSPTRTAATASTSNLPTASSMAPAAVLASSSNSSSTSFHHFPSSFKAKNLHKIKGDPYDPNDKAARMRRGAREKTNSLNATIGDSFERHPVQVVRQEDTESGSDGGSSVAPKVTRKIPKVRLLNKPKIRETRQRLNYDSEEASSPTLLSFQPDIAPGSLSASRAGTPNNFNRPTRKARTGTGLRVKSSPMKKKGGTLAGIPRASGERNSPIGNGASSNNQDDNDDYCSACGGNGDLVCCDGCTRSFHFKCVDPPIIEGALPEEWFCNHCISRRPGARDDPIPGIFGPLIVFLDEKNPSAFHLPKPIREYFENVKTGEDGEYQEAGATKPKNNRGGGYEEAPDYFRLKDAKGKVILCHQCHSPASQPSRMIIPCSFCGLYWHLDCLPNPLAKEPGPGRQWRCPAHIDDLLQLVPAQLAPAHRFRKIKGLPAIKPAISRGIKNSGYIEIESEESEVEEEPGFYEQREYGQVYKLPERGIKLDFISKVRREGGGYVPSRFAHYGPPNSRPRPAWNKRKVDEQQAALNLASLAAHEPQNHDLKQLLSAVLTQAPPNIIDMMAVDQAEAMADKLPKQTILTMKALFDRLYTKVVEGEKPASAILSPAIASPELPATPAETQPEPERAVSQEITMNEISAESEIPACETTEKGRSVSQVAQEVVQDTVIPESSPEKPAPENATINARDSTVEIPVSECANEKTISPQSAALPVTPVSPSEAVETKTESQDEDTEMLL